MKTLIFTWTPAVSHYSKEELRADIQKLHNDEFISLVWPVNNPDVAEGDRVFVLQQDKTNAGICITGYLCSDPVIDDDAFEGQYVVNIDPLTLTDVDEGTFISVDELKKAIPDFDWNGAEGVLSDAQAALLEEIWLNHLYSSEAAFNGVQGAMSWDYELENFESIPAPLQTLYKNKYGAQCEKCGKCEDEVGELAYHFTEDEDPDHKQSLRSHLHCFCNECWF